MGNTCDKEKIGERIAHERGVWGMTQPQLADALCEVLHVDDFSIQKISSYEQGKSFPHVQVVCALAIFFIVPWIICWAAAIHQTRRRRRWLHTLD